MFRDFPARLLHAFLRFEDWFDRSFGWFFTNGMKNRRRPGVARESGRP